MAKTNEVISMEEVQKQIAEMLAAAKAEADRIIAEASAGRKESAETAAKREADKARGEELVEVKLFKDSGKYKDDVFVGCNGETVAIQRGVRVKIKRKFADILDNSEHQDYETAQMIEAKSGEWERKSSSM